MLNVQFMTNEKNGVPTGEVDWRGDQIYRYIPDLDEMIRNASCEEEVEAIKEVEEGLKDGWFDGFHFEIVYTAYDMAFDSMTGKFVKKWQVMQHPWYRDQNGVYRSREEMLKDIEMTQRGA